uniref:glycosyltransferase n=1 Tax=Marinobacterium profundum TaxID=1714300 RepID=UPI001FDF4C9A|nr:glycosyltransferase [Marinobacterium profundum]
MLIVNTLYYPFKVGGAEKSVQLLAEALVRIGHQVHVAVVHDKKNYISVELNGVNVNYFPIRNLYWPFGAKKPVLLKFVWHVIDFFNFKAKKDIDDLISQIKPDVVHTNNLSCFSVSVWSSAYKNKCKIVHTARDYYLLGPNSTLFRNNKCIDPQSYFYRISSILKKYNSKKVDCFVGVSQYMVNVHKALGYFNEAASFSVYNSVEMAGVNRLPSDINNGVIRVGYIGRLEEQKGYGNFLQFVKNIQSKIGEDYKVIPVVAGSGCRKYINIVESSLNVGAIEKLGYTDVNNFISKVDHVVFPLQWNEPFGRAIVECAVAGKPVWINPKGGAAELLAIFPNVNPMDEFSFSFCVREVLNPDVFSSKFVAMKYDEIYKHALSKLRI